MRRFPLWHLAIVAAIALATFANSLSGEFVWDDLVQTAHNPNIRTLSHIPKAFTESFWSFTDSYAPTQSNFYRPLQTVAYTIAYALGELDPAPYHAINIAFHTLASIAVYLVAFELGFTPLLSLLGAALFATHPIHTEAVSWIAATPELICGFFYFAALWTFLKSNNGAHKNYWLASAALMLAGLFAKEMAITLPVIILLLTYRPGAPSIPLARRLSLMLPYAAVTILYMAMRINALGFVATNQNPRQASYLDWISLGFRAFAEYIWLTFIPYPLMAYRLVAIHLSDRLIPTLAAAAAVLVLAALAWTYRRRFPQATLYFAAFFISLVPVFYFKGISNAFMSDRYLYIPSLIAVLFALSLLQRANNQTHVYTAWAIAAVFAGASIVRNQVWSNPETLYTTTLARDNNVAEFHISLSDILLKRNDDPGVLLHLQQALNALDDPTYSQSTFDRYRVRIGIAAVHLRAHRYNEAQAELTAAAKLNPRGEWTAVYTGALLMDRDQNDAGSLPYFQQALKLNPNNEVTYDYLGTALFNLGQLDQALAAFKRAVEINPNHDLARQHLALVQKKLAQP